MDRTSLTRTSFHIRRDQLDALRSHACETGIPASFVIRLGIDMALGVRRRTGGRVSAGPGQGFGRGGRVSSKKRMAGAR